MDKERDRQRQAIADRLNDRRKQKESTLKQKHLVVIEKEQLNARAEREALADNQVCLEVVMREEEVSSLMGCACWV